MKRSREIAILDEFFKRAARRTLIIQTHDIPDPDAMGSAEAFRLIARDRGFRSVIVANGMPQRRENLIFIRECHIHIKSLSVVKIIKPQKYAWVYIDCLPGRGNVTLHQYAPGDVYLAIDHHGKPLASEANSRDAFIIHDSKAGATATVLAEMLRELDLNVTARLATALSYAIISDTQDFSRGALKTDLDMYAFLFPGANQRIISRIRNTTKPRSHFQTVARSLNNAMFYRHIAWVMVGKVDSSETVAEMADMILSTERITWALAVGYTPKRLYLSIRSSSPKAMSSRVIKRIVPRSPRTVGGHDQFAGGFVPLADDADPQETANAIVQRFVRILLRIPRSQPVPEGAKLIDE